MALQSLRRGAKSWVFKGLLIVLAISFAAFFGVTGNPFRRVVSLIEIGDVEIDAQTMIREYNRELQSVARLFGGQIDPDLARRMGLLDQTIRLIVTRTLFDVAARDTGVVATDDQIRAVITASPQFASLSGGFDRLAFENFLRRSGYSEAGFVEITRQDMVRSQYLDALHAGVGAPRTLTDTLFRHREERRVAEVVELRNDDITGVGEPGEAAIAAYYDDNPREFTAPEYRALTAAYLTLAQLAEDIVVSEEEIAEAYESRRVQYEQPERRQIDQIVFDDEAGARKLLALVAGGTALEAAAEEAGAGAPVNLGTLSRAELPLPELAEAAFALEAGAVGGPVATDFGWHVVRVRAVEPAVTKSLAQVRDQLAGDLAQEQARADIFDVLNAVDDALAGGASIEDAAAGGRLTVVRRDAVARDGTTPAGEAADGLPEDPKFLDTAFSTAEGLESQVTETANGGFFVLRVDDVTAPALRPLAEVREDVIAGWQLSERRRLTEERAQEIKERVNGGQALATVAEAFGLTVIESEAFTRAGEGAEGALSRIAVASVFGLDAGEVAVVPVVGGMQVARLIEVQPAGAGGDGRQALGDELARSIGNDLEAQLGAALYDTYGVVVDLPAIERLFDTR